jgi:transposase
MERRKYGTQEKAALVLRYQGGASASALSRETGIDRALILKWARMARETGLVFRTSGRPRTRGVDVEELRQENEKLKQEVKRLKAQAASA